MPNYQGRRKGTRRIVLWHKNRRHEWIVKGTKAEGSAFEARKRLELQAADHETRSAPRFSTLCTGKYRQWSDINVTRSTWRTRSNILATLCIFFKEKKMDTFTMRDTDAYKAHRLATAKLRPSTLNGELRTLVRFFYWAKDQGYPVAVPKVKYLRQPKGRVRVWTREQVDTLLHAAAKRDRELVRLIVFLVNTGCRKGESIAAEWSWVDIERRMLSIPANEAWHPKNARAREVTISDACRTVLSGPRASKRWVFTRGDGERFVRFPDAIFKELQNEAWISGGPHTLRHSFASFFLQKKPDLFALGQVLGHGSLQATQIYAHLLPGHLAETRNAVNIAPPLTTVAKTVAKRARRGERKALLEPKTAAK